MQNVRDVQFSTHFRPFKQVAKLIVLKITSSVYLKKYTFSKHLQSAEN